VGLRGARIPLAARISTVVDGFDASMTSESKSSSGRFYAVLKEMHDQDDGRYAPDMLRALIAGLGTGV